MHDILEAIDRWQQKDEAVAVATVIRTTGSTPRPLGSRMAVSQGGAMAGSVSGGCIEGAVFEEAQQVLADGRSRRVEYGVSDEQAWAVGLSCGGTIEVLVEPVAAATHHSTLREIVLAERSAWVATSLPARGRGASPEPGLAEGTVRRLVVFDDGDVVGTLGSEPADRAALQACRRAEETGVVATGTDAGDDLELFIERFAPQPTLMIVGAVHVAIHLVHLAGRAGFRSVVVDARAAFATEERFPHADELHVAWPAKWFQERRLHDQSYCVFLTHDPKLDDPALAVVLEKPVRYVGALGSRRTHAKRVQSLRELGVHETAIERIQAPIGLDLGGRKPEEIAVSIVSQLVAARYDRLAADGGLLGRGEP